MPYGEITAAGTPQRLATGLLNDPKVHQRASESERFQSELQELNVRNARLGAWFVMLLVPFCSVLDWLAFPDKFWEFLLLRITCSACCVPLLLALDRPNVAKYHRIYPIILPLLPAVAICVMLYLTGDAGSGYYAGLSLCLVGTSFVFHWTFREIGLTIGLILAAYFAATLPNLDWHGGLRGNALFFNNSIFILMNCLILFMGSRQHHAIRMQEFVNRCKVEDQRKQLIEQNDELTSTLARLKETEAQLTQSDKLASIGRLSAGIVHEINNPLNFVKSAVYVLKKKGKNLPPDVAAAIQQIADDIGEGVDRVASIVSDLRTFAHPENRGSRVTALSDCTGKALRLLAKEVQDRGVHLECKVEPGHLCLGDENYIIQIILNLVQNGLDALTDRPQPTILIAASCDEQRSVLTIRDNGTGIPEENLKRIFDPFFTTKEVGKGMGLGLSLCYRMMQQMGGTIEVKTRCNEYTEFRLILPPPPAA